jgi:hypothetical protein
MSAAESLRRMIDCVNDLKASQGTMAFNATLRRLYRTAEMAVPHSVTAKQQADQIAAATGEVTAAVTKPASKPSDNEYVERRLSEIHEEKAREVGVSVEEIRCAGL